MTAPVTVNALSLTTLLKDTVSSSTAEACLQQAIRSINLEGLEFDLQLRELSDTPLTGTYSGAEAAGILQVAIAVYSVNYKSSGASSSNSESFGVGPISASNSSSSSVSSSGNASSVVGAVAHDVAVRLHNAQGRNWSKAII